LLVFIYSDGGKKAWGSSPFLLEQGENLFTFIEETAVSGIELQVEMRKTR